MKEYRETAREKAAEAKESIRNAADDFRAKAMEKADQRKAEDRARRAEACVRGEGTAPAESVPEAPEPVEPEAVEEKK